MEIFADIFAGLGFFFIGIRLIGNNLKQLTGRRMRLLITKMVSGNGSVALFGLLAGGIMQSVNAVTYVLVALVTAGAIEKRRAFQVINWANIGTSALVVVAALKLHLLVLLLIGITGITYYRNLDQSARYRHAVSALLGIGLLFLGIDYIKAGSSILKGADWLKVFLIDAGNYPAISFMVGTVVALLVQSSSTITVIAMAMASAGLLQFDSGSMIVIGAGLGSALSAWALAGRQGGSTRQLILFQIILKTMGVAIVLMLYGIDRLIGLHTLSGALISSGLSPSGQLAVIYVLLQIASDLGMRVVQAPVERLLERQAPPSEEEVLGKPYYIHDDALVEPESALMLVEKEQQRLVACLSSYLDHLRKEGMGEGPTVQVRQTAEKNILRQCDQFLTDLADRNHNRMVLEKTIILRDRNELLNSLQESLVELCQAAKVETPNGEGVTPLLDNLVESLHMMLETLADVAKSPNSDDLDMLRMLTHDRSELMDAIRRRNHGLEISPDVRQAVFSATALFERCIWLLRRYVLLLQPQGEHAPV